MRGEGHACHASLGILSAEGPPNHLTACSRRSKRQRYISAWKFAQHTDPAPRGVLDSDELQESASSTGHAASGKTADVSYTPLSLQTAMGGMRSMRGPGSNLALLQMLQQRREPAPTQTQAPKPPLNLRGSSRRLSSGTDPTLASSVAGDAAGVSTAGASQSETSSPERGDAGYSEVPARQRSLQRVDSRVRRMVSPTPYGNDTDEEDAAGGALMSVSLVGSSRKVPHASSGTFPLSLSPRPPYGLVFPPGELCTHKEGRRSLTWPVGPFRSRAIDRGRVGTITTTVRAHIHAAPRANPVALL